MNSYTILLPRRKFLALALGLLTLIASRAGIKSIFTTNKKCNNKLPGRRAMFFRTEQ